MCFGAIFTVHAPRPGGFTNDGCATTYFMTSRRFHFRCIYSASQLSVVCLDLRLSGKDKSWDFCFGHASGFFH
jgi:hypothetical protein